MAEIDLLLQGLRDGDDHGTAVNELLAKTDIDQFILSLAFVRREGVSQLAGNLNRVSDKIEMFVGIRNGITSVQGIALLLQCGIEPFAVDTASNSRIFHPKIYAAYGENSANVILGSANLTFSGLNRNIEASSVLTLDRESPSDEAYLLKLLDVFRALPASYPDHVFQIKAIRDAVVLMKEGRLEDERVSRLPAANTVNGNRARDELKPIPTFVKSAHPPKKGVRRRRVAQAANTGTLVWESGRLTERSLNIPSGRNTNVTGDTNFGRGAMEDIDFQRYFRDIVFDELNWSTDLGSQSPHLERATVNAEIVIKNIAYGIFVLEVTHDPRTTTQSYAQHNAMTKLKWGEAKQLIAKRDLLSRTLKLYKKSPHDFAIVID